MFSLKRVKTKKQLSKIKGASLKFKTANGSRSGLDTSLQTQKQAQKSHATVPLILRLSSDSFLWTIHFIGMSLIKSHENLKKITFTLKFKTKTIL
jgi:hypothetical protein